MTWQELQQMNSSELITLIKLKEQAEHVETAEAAFTVFTYRFSKEIIDKCRKIIKNFDLAQETADLIATRCFDRFWKYPNSFDSAKCKQLDREKCILLYLFRIAQRCFFDYLNEVNGEISPYDGTEEVVIDFPQLESLELTEEQSQQMQAIYKEVKNALDSLSPKHRIIYLTYKRYEQDGFKLPRPLLQKLREELKLSQNTIRVYKKEAFETVEKKKQSYESK